METGDLVIDYEQCQVVAAEGTANFLLKDGNNDPEGKDVMGVRRATVVPFPTFVLTFY